MPSKVKIFFNPNEISESIGQFLFCYATLLNSKSGYLVTLSAIDIINNFQLTIKVVFLDHFAPTLEQTQLYTQHKAKSSAILSKKTSFFKKQVQIGQNV